MMLLDNEFLSCDDVLLVPQYGVLPSRTSAEMMPFIYGAPMDTVTGYRLAETMLGLGEYPVICRFQKEEWLAGLKDFHQNRNCFFAVGSIERLHSLIDALESLDKAGELGANPKVSIAVDLAHGDSVVAKTAIQFLRNCDFVGSIMSGSICTPGAALRNAEWGATHLRIGVGPGSACTTRLQTGCGMPQLTAVYMTYRAVQKENIEIQIIADGGVRRPGDAVKYLAAGADGVMLGRRLSTTPESCGWIVDDGTDMIGRMRAIVRPSSVYKHFRGQASAEFQQEVLGEKNRCSEGASSARLTPGASAVEVIEEFRGGVSAAISLLGLSSIKDLLPDSVEWIRVTQAGYVEGTPHGV